MINESRLKIYINDFDKKDDHNEKVVCAVWTTIINGVRNVENNILEFEIYLFKEYRGKRIGTLIIKSMIQLLKEKGYLKAYLAVQKDRHSFKMHKNIGFKIFYENEEEYMMICNL
ncbi:GNAT family N-acetyltransferase [Clostridium botulinum]|uniref:GNAT family N-acetyltransferase n=1 Tax=Clostridium botulinum TaxID=1491 RepID=UPI003DA62AB8